jgi:hypothetical protein
MVGRSVYSHKSLDKGLDSSTFEAFFGIIAME